MPAVAFGQHREGHLKRMDADSSADQVPRLLDPRRAGDQQAAVAEQTARKHRHRGHRHIPRIGRDVKCQPDLADIELGLLDHASVAVDPVAPLVALADLEHVEPHAVRRHYGATKERHMSVLRGVECMEAAAQAPEPRRARNATARP